MTIGSFDAQRSEISMPRRSTSGMSKKWAISARQRVSRVQRRSLTDVRSARFSTDVPHLPRILGIEHEPIRKRGQALRACRRLPAAPPHERRQARQPQRRDRVVQVVGAQTFERHRMTAPRARLARGCRRRRSGPRGRRRPSAHSTACAASVSRAWRTRDDDRRGERGACGAPRVARSMPRRAPPRCPQKLTSTPSGQQRLAHNVLHRRPSRAISASASGRPPFAGLVGRNRRRPFSAATARAPA